ncbi:MAG: ImmA/IrrE family metallo-endopeptidase, partial [Actinomycetota bacterium]|nr:ImmA/IrrE family metallo-endopeptidase [Actinomycetota bacterium]
MTRPCCQQYSGGREPRRVGRTAQGQTQAELAAEVGITQAALSRYENDLREPEPEVLVRLADTLGVTPAFLTQAGRARGGMAMDAHMRRRATAPPGTWRQLEARLNMYRWHASHLFEEVSLRAEQHVPTLDLFDVTPEQAARFVRSQWRMPVGPVRGLAQWLEAAGCVLIGEDFATSRVDGLSQWVGDHPVILFNSGASPDRLRLTLAHELGHLVLHADALSVDDVEAQANAFAAELLMPAEVIRPALRNLKIGRLLDLKREYGVSMQALVERAYHLQLLSPSQRTNMYKSFSAKGWRTREPGSEDIAPERPLGPPSSGRCRSGSPVGPRPAGP